MPQHITLFVERLTVIDACYLDAQRGLLGESWIVDIELEGELNYQGMILDFGDVKKQVKQLIDLEFDHKLIIPDLYEGSQHQNTSTHDLIRFRLTSGQIITHQSPASALCLIETNSINKSSLTTAIIAKLRPILPKNITQIRINLHTEPKTTNQYQYAHGLKQHQGNCQRIAHGHRSYIQIFENGERNTELEKQWAKKWTDIYLGSEEDLSKDNNNSQQYRFHYTAAQGDFALIMPKEKCYIINTETTVENIAQHIANSLKQQRPNSNFQVKAFEGVGKGALGKA